MVNTSPDPAHGDDPGVVSSRETKPPKAPRWVKVSAIVVGILILLFVIMQLTGLAGEHGPGRHGAAQPVTTATVQTSGVG